MSSIMCCSCIDTGAAGDRSHGREIRDCTGGSRSSPRRGRSYTIADLRDIGNYVWRLSEGNVWKVERMLLQMPHRRLHTSNARINRLRKRYREYRAKHGRKPIYYKRMDRWTDLPEEFRR